MILTDACRYNARSHPMPFMQAGGAAPAAKAAPKEVPDLEEAIEESDDAEVLIDPAQDEDEDVDISKDKYIKKPKKKAAPRKTAAKKKAAGSDDDDEPMPAPKKCAPAKPRASRTKK